MVKKHYYNFVLFFCSVCVITLIFDVFTKYLILLLKPQIDWKLFKIHLITNTGAGFGILQGKTRWLGIVSLIATAAILCYYRSIPKYRIPQFLWGLFLGGVLGNLVDRSFRGYVIDFIDFSFWPAFNVADMAISIAAVGLIVYYWKK